MVSFGHPVRYQDAKGKPLNYYNPGKWRYYNIYFKHFSNNLNWKLLENKHNNLGEKPWTIEK